MTAEQSGAGPSSEDGVFSLDDLDKIIEAEDPTFKEAMAGIKATGVDSLVDIETIDVDGENGNSLPDENRELSSLEKKIEFIKKKISNILQYIKVKSLGFKTFILSFGVSSVQFLRHGLPERLKYYQSQVSSFSRKIFGFLKEEWLRFKALSRLEKIGLVFVIVSTVFAFFFISKVYTGGWLPRFSDPLIHSLEEEAVMVMEYKKKEDMQNLFQAFPEINIYVLLNKVIVNLRADENSTPTPMGVYEIYLGLDSKDTAVEIKARENEMRDVIQRVLEPFSYTEVSSQVGKVRMKSAIRDQVNLLLNQGQVIHVYFNTFITKP